MSIVVVGNVAYDYVGYADYLYNDDRCSDLRSLRIAQGGRGANYCAVASSLGDKTTLLAHVGKDFAQSNYERDLLDRGVDLSHIYETGLQLSPRAFIFSSGAENRMTFYRAIEESQSYALRAHVAAAARRLDCDVLVATSGDPQHNIAALGSTSARVRILAPAHDVGLYSSPQLAQCLDVSTILTVNLAEAEHVEQLLGMNLATVLSGFSLDLVLITRGADGLTVLTRDATVEVEAFRPRLIVDTVGAGDAFLAGFVHLYRSSNDYHKSARFGSAVASLSLEGRGCQEAVPTAGDAFVRADLLP
jgi:nucleoside kinase